MTCVSAIVARLKENVLTYFAFRLDWISILQTIREVSRPVRHYTSPLHAKRTMPLWKRKSKSVSIDLFPLCRMEIDSFLTIDSFRSGLDFVIVTKKHIVHMNFALIKNQLKKITQTHHCLCRATILNHLIASTEWQRIRHNSRKWRLAIDFAFNWTRFHHSIGISAQKISHRNYIIPGNIDDARPPAEVLYFQRSPQDGAATWLWSRLNHQHHNQIRKQIENNEKKAGSLRLVYLICMRFHLVDFESGRASFCCCLIRTKEKTRKKLKKNRKIEISFHSTSFRLNIMEKQRKTFHDCTAIRRRH